MNALDAVTIKLINSKLEKQEFVSIFTSGVFRGRLNNIEVVVAQPEPTYRLSHTGINKPEECAVLTYTPGPKARDKVTDPRTFKFTRKPTTIAIPVRALSGLTLNKLMDGLWILTINSKIKGDDSAAV